MEYCIIGLETSDTPVIDFCAEMPQIFMVEIRMDIWQHFRIYLHKMRITFLMIALHAKNPRL